MSTSAALCSTQPLVDASLPLLQQQALSHQSEKHLHPQYTAPPPPPPTHDLQVLQHVDNLQLVLQAGSSQDHQLLQKTTIDILGICCPAEVPLVRKILEPLPGVQNVVVNVAARTVIVQHDATLTSAAWLVKLLNDAKLEASIHHQGEWKLAAHKWPSPYTIASGIMVALTFFQYIFSPLRWVGLGAVAVGIPPVIMKSLISLRRCIMDINILMLIAVGGALCLGDFLEAGSIVFLFTLADWLESRSSDKARRAISAVAGLAPQTAFLADNGGQVPVGEVGLGARLSVKAGEQVPIDGVVIFGKSMVNESSLTGEAVPVEKEAGATVWAGTLNVSGYLCIQTTALAEESAVARMIRLVEAAQTQRSRVEQLVEKFAKYYTPAVVSAATTIAVIPLLMHAHNLRHWLYMALVLLVVACPCALVLSTPVATTCAIAQAARMGLIVKGGSCLEALGKLEVMALDKTGTLTEGHFQVTEVQLASNGDIEITKLLDWISSIESKSSHPMASSLVAYAKLHEVAPSTVEVENFTLLAGEGVSGVVDGHVIHIGNERLATRLQWTQGEAATSEAAVVLETWKSQGWSISWIGVDEKLEAIMCAGDEVRSEAQDAISDLRKLGLHIVMLTGDSLAAANVAKEKLGEMEVHAALLPQDKVEVLKQLKKRMGSTAMVGDGINDAPALATADVGIAMGVAGSAVAMETADIALMTNDLRQLAAAVKLGRRVRWKIRQNIFLSVITKLIIIILAGVGYASLWGAVLADVGTCLLVIFNSMLLLGKEKCEEHTCGHTRHECTHGGHHAYIHQYHQQGKGQHHINCQDGSKHICPDHHFHDREDYSCHDGDCHVHNGDDHCSNKMSCLEQGGTCSCCLKLKLFSGMVKSFINKKQNGGCCNHTKSSTGSVERGSCTSDCGHNSGVRRRLVLKDACAKKCVIAGIDHSATTSVFVDQDGLAETAAATWSAGLSHAGSAYNNIKCSDHHRRSQLHHDFHLCATYCTDDVGINNTAPNDQLFMCDFYCTSSSTWRSDIGDDDDAAAPPPKLSSSAVIHASS